MGNPSFGKGWHERGLFEGPRTKAKVEQAFKAGQRSGGWMSLAGSAASAVIIVAGNVAYDRWKAKRAAKSSPAEPGTA